MTIPVQKMSSSARLPEFSHATDAGCDLFSVEDVTIKAGERALVGTGIAMAIPQGYAGLIWDKSGRAVKDGLTTLAGVIDAGYRGEVKVAIFNTATEDVKIVAGEKVAQMLFQQVAYATFEDMATLEKGDRGEEGFGSTGLK